MRHPLTQRELVELSLIRRPAPRPKPAPINRDPWGRR